jgi:hypothetical protein
MLRDLADAATARRMALHPLRQISAGDWLQNISMFLFLFWGAATNTACDERLRRALFAFMTVVAGYGLLITNAQMNAFPLNAYAAVALAANRGSLTIVPPKWSGFTRDFAKVWLLAICLLPLSIENAASLAGAALEQQWPVMPIIGSVALPARGAYLHFRLVAGEMRTETAGADYVTALNDGLELIRRHTDSDGVLTFDEFNPFNYLLGRPPPRGGFAAAAYDYVFCDTAHPAANRFLGNAHYVMVRKYAPDGSDVLETGDVQGLMSIYGSALRSQYTLVEQTKHWALWQHNAPSH